MTRERRPRPKAWLLAHLTDRDILNTARALDKPTINADERLLKAWLIGELEQRHPEVEPLLDAWVETTGPQTESYVVALERGLRELGIVE